MNSTASPRFIASSEATGESMPPDSSVTARPLVPTGRPPAPSSSRTCTYAARIDLDPQLERGRRRSTGSAVTRLQRGADLALELAAR